jgi:hypothetical protein
MQTFVPYSDFTASAKVLDRQRLGKQRVENLQILNALLDPTYGWQNHPAVTMWRGYEYGLLEYHRAICSEWVGRGYKDTCWEKFCDRFNQQIVQGLGTPPWLGNEAVHRSHRSNLLRKAPAHYAHVFEADLPDNLEYVWPGGGR